jgi:hypothetical protein
VRPRNSPDAQHMARMHILPTMSLASAGPMDHTPYAERPVRLVASCGSPRSGRVVVV